MNKTATNESEARTEQEHTTPGGRITASDIERRLRDVVGGASDSVEEMSSAAFAKAALVLVALLLAAFIFGRRRGRKKTTTVEVVRV